MFCKNCGAQIKNNAIMCVNCGTLTSTRLIPPFVNFSKNGISKSEITQNSPLSPIEIDERILNLSKYGLLFDVIGRNVLSNGFEYSITANMGLCSWGELIYIKCIENSHQSTVNIFSKCAFPFQIIAWGKHKRNINAIKSVLDMELE